MQLLSGKTEMGRYYCTTGKQCRPRSLEMKITTLASYRMGNFNWGPVYVTTSFLRDHMQQNATPEHWIRVSTVR